MSKFRDNFLAQSPKAWLVRLIVLGGAMYALAAAFQSNGIRFNGFHIAALAVTSTVAVDAVGMVLYRARNIAQIYNWNTAFKLCLIRFVFACGVSVYVANQWYPM